MTRDETLKAAGDAVVSLIAWLLERSGVIQQGPITAMARYFLAIAAFIAVPILLILAFGR